MNITFLLLKSFSRLRSQGNCEWETHHRSVLSHNVRASIVDEGVHSWRSWYEDDLLQRFGVDRH